MKNENEQKYLEFVYQYIVDSQKAAIESIQFTKEELKTCNRDMWETVSNAPNNLKELDGLVQAKAFLDQMEQGERNLSSKKRRLEMLDRMEKSAYFGRIDFCEDGELNEEKIYIGIATLADESSYDIYVYDWRAPIASLFYDADIGKVSYNAPNGKIDGSLLLRRQFKIKKEKLLYMFDTNVKIDDEMLMEVLSKNTDDKMKTIVMTIQRDQNKIIRDESNDVLFAMGPAGSGKTSVALHRIAYLLYRFRDQISSDEILILSPNQIFTEYISHVLPELGEQNVSEQTLVTLMKKIFKKEFRLQSFASYMEAVLFRNDDERNMNIKRKSDESFLKAIDEYISTKNVEMPFFKDIVFEEEIIMSKKEILSLYVEDVKYFHIVDRLERIANRIENLVKPIRNWVFKREYDRLMNDKDYYSKAEAKRMAKRKTDMLFLEIDNLLDQFHNVSFEKLYLDFLLSYEPMLEPITRKQFEKRYLLYEDMSPYAYFLTCLGVIKQDKKIRHIVVDEVQDYPLITIKWLERFYPNSKFTLLGDPNQLINKGLAKSDVDSMPSVFENRKRLMVKMDKCYRSSYEIFMFCKKILDKESEEETVLRHESKPIIAKSEVLIEDVIRYINLFRKEGLLSISIITKNMQEARSLYEMIIKKDDSVMLIDNEDSLLKKGCLVMPSYFAKGLEFDCVIIPDANHEKYVDEGDRKILYTMASRALHRLCVLYKEKPSRFIYGGLNNDSQS